MNVARAFAADFVVYAIARVIAAVAWVATVSVLTAKLAPSQYAQFWQIFTLVTGTATLTTSWLVTAQRRFYARFEQDDQLQSYMETSIVSTKICIAISLFIFGAFLLINWTFSLVQLDVIQWTFTSIAFVLSVTFLVYCGHLIAARQPWKYLLFNAGQSILLLAALFVALNFLRGDGVSWSIAVLAASYGVFMLIVTVSQGLTGVKVWKRAVPLWNQAALAHSIKHLRFGLPLVLMNFSFFLSNIGTQLIIENTYSSKAAGIYAAYYSPIERIVGFVTTVAATALIPLLANQWEQGHQRQALRFLWLIIMATMAVTGIISAIIIVFGSSFATHMVEAEYLSGVKLIAPIAVSCFIFGVASILADVLIIKQKTLLLALMFAIATVIGLATALAIVPEQGALGGVYSRVVFSFTSLLLVGIAVFFAVAKDFSNHKYD